MDLFSIRVVLRFHTLSGLAALDERRRLGLTDGVRLESQLSYPVDKAEIEVPVDEEFARSYFESRNTILETVFVGLNALQPGDVELVRRQTDDAITDRLKWADIHPDRVRDLFVAVREGERTAPDKEVPL